MFELCLKLFLTVFMLLVLRAGNRLGTAARVPVQAICAGTSSRALLSRLMLHALISQ
jgi:hypothetical protein